MYQMGITVYKQKTINKNKKKENPKKKFRIFFRIFFFFKITKLRPETESRNSGDHEL
jgi:hypothetical protein